VRKNSSHAHITHYRFVVIRFNYNRRREKVKKERENSEKEKKYVQLVYESYTIMKNR